MLIFEIIYWEKTTQKKKKNKKNTFIWVIGTEWVISVFTIFNILD